MFLTLLITSSDNRLTYAGKTEMKFVFECIISCHRLPLFCYKTSYKFANLAGENVSFEPMSDQIVARQPVYDMQRLNCKKQIGLLSLMQFFVETCLLQGRVK